MVVISVGYYIHKTFYIIKFELQVARVTSSEQNINHLLEMFLWLLIIIKTSDYLLNTLQQWD